jgi:hypothetical protein
MLHFIIAAPRVAAAPVPVCGSFITLLNDTVILLTLLFDIDIGIDCCLTFVLILVRHRYLTLVTDIDIWLCWCCCAITAGVRRERQRIGCVGEAVRCAAGVPAGAVLCLEPLFPRGRKPHHR